MRSLHIGGLWASRHEWVALLSKFKDSLRTLHLSSVMLNHNECWFSIFELFAEKLALDCLHVRLLRQGLPEDAREGYFELEGPDGRSAFKWDTADGIACGLGELVKTGNYRFVEW